MPLSKITKVDKTLHSEYVDTRLTNATIPVSDTIKINRLFTFSNRPDTRKKGENVGMLKQSTTLITQLFISLQSRPAADMVIFFKHSETNENPLLYRIVVCLEREKSYIYWLVSKLQQPAFVQQHMFYLWLLSFIWCAQLEYVSLNVVLFQENQPTSTVERVDAIWDTYPEETWNRCSYMT